MKELRRSAGRILSGIPKPWRGPVNTQVADESNRPWNMNNGFLPALGGDFGPPVTRCISNIYPSSVITWCFSAEYSYLVSN